MKMDPLNYRKQLRESLAHLKTRLNGASSDNNALPGYAKPTTPFRPYNDYYVNLEDDPYENEVEDSSEAEEAVLTRFINNLLANQMLALAGNKEYHEEFDGQSAYSKEKIPDIYKVRPNNEYNYGQCNERLPRKKIRHGRQSRTTRRSRGGEEERGESMFAELPVGSELTVQDGTLMINLPLVLLRQYMYSEVEARVYTVNAHYKREWQIINRERMVSLAELVQVQETARKMRNEMAEMVKTMKTFKDKCDNLGSKMDTNKEAKRRRRQAKKQRKTEKVPEYQSQTGGGDGNVTHIDIDPAMSAETADDVE